MKLSILFRLTWLLLKAYGLGFAGDTNRASTRPGKAGKPVKPRRRFPVILLFPLLFSPLAVSLTMFANLLYDLLSQLGFQAAIVGLATGAGAVIVFFFGVFYVLGIFYFSSDVEKLLPLPLRASEILGAKFLVTAVYEYIGSLLLLAPLYLTFGVRSGAGVAYYLTVGVVYVFLPFIPLVIASILVMVLMRFTTFARNRDAFNIVVSLLILLAAFGFNYGVNSLAQKGVDASFVAKLLGADGGTIAEVTSSLFPGTGFAARAIATAGSWESLGYLALFLLICVALFALFLLVGSALYFAGAQGSGTSGSRGRRLSSSEFEKGTASAPALLTYIKKELRILVRTPIFLLNNVIMNFLFPFFLLLPLAATGGGSASDPELKLLLDTLRSGVFQGDGALPIVAFAVAFGFMLFGAGTNGIASTALSRDGESCWFMKTIPMAYRDQILAKAGTGVLLSLCGTIIAGVVIGAIVSPPLWFIGLLLLAALVASVLPNAVGIVFDLRWPKLHWDNEQKAVKQNVNVVFEMLVTYAIGALAIVPPLVFAFPPALGYVFMLAVPTVFTIAFVAWVRARGANWIVAQDM